MCFPLPGSRTPRSAWQPLWKHGYISSYHKMVSGFSSGEEARLHTALELIFANLQCLPDAVADGTTRAGKLWTLNNSKTGPIFLANPLLYKISEVGQINYQTTKRIAAPNAHISAHLQGEHLGVPVKLALQREKRAKNIVKKQQRRSTKSLNASKPPVRQRQVNPPQSKSTPSPSSHSSSKHSEWQNGNGKGSGDDPYDSDVAAEEESIEW
jgi:hypothetical protein